MRISNKLNHIAIYNPGDASAYSTVLNANESYLKPSEKLMAQLHQVLDSTALNRYPDVLANDLCQSFADFYEIENKGIVCGTGSDELIGLLMTCLVAPKDKVLTLQPDFSMYGHYAMMAGVQEVRWQKNKAHQIDVAEVVQMANAEDVAMIIFSNPCNPTGVGLVRDQVLNLVKAFDGLVVVDEAYMDFWDQSVLSEVSQCPNLIVMRTCSKALALAGLRVGFAVMHPSLVERLWAGKSPFNVGNLTQGLASCVLKAKEELLTNIQIMKTSVESLYQETQRLIAGSDALKLVPTQANFFLLETNLAQDLAQVLSREGILVRVFPTGLRICCGSEQDNQTFIQALAQAIKEVCHD